MVVDMAEPGRGTSATLALPMLRIVKFPQCTSGGGDLS